MKPTAEKSPNLFKNLPASINDNILENVSNTFCNTSQLHSLDIDPDYIVPKENFNEATILYDKPVGKISKNAVLSANTSRKINSRVVPYFKSNKRRKVARKKQCRIKQHRNNVKTQSFPKDVPEKSHMLNECFDMDSQNIEHIFRHLLNQDNIFPQEVTDFEDIIISYLANEQLDQQWQNKVQILFDGINSHFYSRKELKDDSCSYFEDEVEYNFYDDITIKEECFEIKKEFIDPGLYIINL